MQSTDKKTDELIQRYVDILTNGGFKALFGDIENKEAVMSIINTLLPTHRKVVDIEYMPTEYQGLVVGKHKEYQYDFMCRDASRAYDRQNRRGQDYDVPPVYLIGLMDTEIRHPDKEFWKDRYVSEYTFREKDSHDLLDETIVIIFAELARFCKTEAECVTDQPLWLQNEIFSRIFRACEIAGFTEEKRIIYEKDMMDEKRLNGQYAAYRNLGREEGREEGERHKALDIAKKLLADGMSKEKILEITDVCLDDLE